MVRGDLAPLSASEGDFAAALTDCLANDLTEPQFTDTEVPGAAQAFWYLVRAVHCGVLAGSYDSVPPPPAGSRDAEIAASPDACP